MNRVRDSEIGKPLSAFPVVRGVSGQLIIIEPEKNEACIADT